MGGRTRALGIALAGLITVVAVAGSTRQVLRAQEGAPGTQGTHGKQGTQGTQAQGEANRLVIEEFAMAENRSLADAIAEATSLVQKMRATGEYKSVKLFAHEWGAEVGVFILSEPKSWASIKTGWEKLVAANPSIMTDPYRWGRHADQILTEVDVR